jgi:hypothetical protein
VPRRPISLLCSELEIRTRAFAAAESQTSLSFSLYLSRSLARAVLSTIAPILAAVTCPPNKPPDSGKRVSIAGC